MEYFIGFVILLGVLIFVHEFGHFLVAKSVGVKVLKFSLGFPPAAIKRKWGETEYILSWIPLGGYVKLLGEDPESDEEVSPEDEGRSFSGKPLLARMAVVAAGPLSNYIIAMVLLCIGFAAGWRPVYASEIGKVIENTPAMEAGVKAGDTVTAVDGVSVKRWEDMRRLIEKKPEQQIVLSVERDGQTKKIPITPQLSEQKDLFGNPRGQIGVAPSGKEIELGFVGAIYEGTRFTFHLTGLVVETLVRIVKGEMSSKALSGPITIVQASGESLKAGVSYFIFLLSFISINLAIINLLPVPILDGGHLMFFAIEAVIRRPVTGKVREIATHAGLVFIIFLMVLVFYNDITRVLTQGWSLQPK